MTSDYTELIRLVQQCISLVSELKTHIKDTMKSKTTCNDYSRLAKNLLETSLCCEVPMREIVQRTTRSTTFYKRVAALQYYIFEEMYSLSSTLRSATDDNIREELVSNFKNLVVLLEELVAIRRIGMVGPRSARRSKRQALFGLPNNWRTLICRRGEYGKYSLPLLVCALTGARPHELVHGIEIKTEFCDEIGQNRIRFYLRGAKVSAKQGQPIRVISYAVSDENPLIQSLLKQLNKKTESEIMSSIKIESAVNFTIEVRRLAKDLWPKHRHPITAYCFRHQWASDIKALGDGDAVSRGLGHITTKTRRQYGTNKQASSGEQLKPVHIQAERSIKNISFQKFKLPNRNANYEPKSFQGN